MKKDVNNKLAFSKASVMELNDLELDQLNGGSSNLISLIVEITTYGTWLKVV